MAGCETNDYQWENTHALPIALGQQNLWVVRVRAPAETAPSALLESVREAFSLWAGYFPPGVAIGLPHLYSLASSELTPLLASLDGVEWRGPSHDVPVKFNVGGPDGERVLMRWPTYAARRRERKPDLCPDPPIDTAPLQVHESLGPALIVGPTVKPKPPQGPPPPGLDPWDVGLPAVDLEAHRKQIQQAAWALGFAAVLGIGLVMAVKKQVGSSRYERFA